MKKRRTLTHAGGVAAICLSVTTVAGPCRADNVEEAMQHHAQALALFKDGAYEGALTELERAYKLAPTYRLLYNIAQVYRQLNNFALAYDAYDRYLKEGGVDIAASRREEVRLEMVKLATRIGRIQVTTNVRDADVTIDDAPAPNALNGPVTANSGRRRVTVYDRALGRQESRLVDVVGRETARVDITFPVAPVTTSDLPRPELRPRPPTGPIDYTPAWIASGVTTALAVAGAITGGLALDAKSDYESELSRGPNNESDLDSADKRATSLAITTDILLGGALAAAVTTVVLYVTRKPADIRASRVGVELSGIGLVGRF